MVDSELGVIALLTGDAVFASSLFEHDVTVYEIAMRARASSFFNRILIQYR